VLFDELVDSLANLLRQSVYSRLADHECANDGKRASADQPSAAFTRRRRFGLNPVETVQPIACPFLTKLWF
jgi:hypothetical protein